MWLALAPMASISIAFKKRGIPFSRAGVGDRHVLEMMQSKGWSLGGESSGHIICKDVATTGDGVISALQVVNALHILALPLAQAKKGMIKMPQTMINVRTHKKVDINASEPINKAVASTQKLLGDSGRVLLRPSGTEPVIRVMVEGKDSVQVNELAEQLANQVEEALC